jgi:hypothetical protein
VINWNAYYSNSAIDTSSIEARPFPVEIGAISFDGGATQFNPVNNPANQLLLGSGTSSISSLPSGSLGQYLQSNGGGLPQWVDLPQPIRLLNQSISSAVVSSWNNGHH